jgi:hypothetical protein
MKPIDLFSHFSRRYVKVKSRTVIISFSIYNIKTLKMTIFYFHIFFVWSLYICNHTNLRKIDILFGFFFILSFSYTYVLPNFSDVNPTTNVRKTIKMLFRNFGCHWFYSLTGMSLMKICHHFLPYSCLSQLVKNCFVCIT